jgi:hypothetical protein
MTSAGQDGIVAVTPASAVTAARQHGTHRDRSSRHAALAIAVAAVALVVYAVITLVRPGSDWFMLVFGNVALTVYPLCCTWMCALGWRGVRSGQRAGLVVLGSSAAAFAVGQGAWAYYELVADRPLPFPPLADVGFLGCVTQPLIGMALLVPRGRNRLGIGLDGALICASLLYLSWAFVLVRS